MSTCPKCDKPIDASVAQGLCPECLLKAGLAGESSAGQSAHKFTPPPPQELAKFFPQLDILELLGRGGMGAVYKARQKNLDRIVALKILPPDIGQDPAFSQRFVREAKALAKLNHPNIITLYEFGQAEGYFFFLMEFIDGMNLGQLLDAGRVPPREALAIVPQVCDGLQYAHDHGIVHRDIKPANIMLDRRGRVKVADFGLAKLVGGADPAGSRATTIATTASSAHGSTEAGQVLGTPQYMAPEQIERPADVDHRADIYSLGVVIYELLTGELPPSKLVPPSRKYQIDVRLDEVVLRAMEKQPEHRYQQASEIKTQVETIAAGPAAKAAPAVKAAPGLASRLVDETWRPAVIIAAIAMLVLLLGAFLIGTMKHSSMGTSVTSTQVAAPVAVSVPSNEAVTLPDEVQPKTPAEYVKPRANEPKKLKPQIGDVNPFDADPAVVSRKKQKEPIGDINPFDADTAAVSPKKQKQQIGDVNPFDTEPAVAAPKKQKLQIGEAIPDEPQPNARQDELELLRIQLRQAEKAVPLLEAQEKAGLIERAKVLDANDNIEILKAQIAGDRLQVARLRLAMAKRQLELAEVKFARGLVDPLELQAAKNSAELRQAELRIVEKASQKSR